MLFFWVDMLFCNRILLLQSADYSPQQETLLKKQAETLEEVKALTNQVRTHQQEARLRKALHCLKSKPLESLPCDEYHNISTNCTHNANQANKSLFFSLRPFSDYTRRRCVTHPWADEKARVKAPAAVDDVRARCMTMLCFQLLEILAQMRRQIVLTVTRERQMDGVSHQ